MSVSNALIFVSGQHSPQKGIRAPQIKSDSMAGVSTKLSPNVLMYRKIKNDWNMTNDTEVSLRSTEDPAGQTQGSMNIKTNNENDISCPTE